MAYILIFMKHIDAQDLQMRVVRKRMGELVYIAKHSGGGNIKIYDYDHDDFAVETSGDVRFDIIFVSKCKGIDTAIERTCDLNKILILEVIKS